MGLGASFKPKKGSGKKDKIYVHQPNNLLPYGQGISSPFVHKNRLS